MARFVQYTNGADIAPSDDYGIVGGELRLLLHMPEEARRVVFCMPDAPRWREAWGFRAGTPHAQTFEVPDESACYIRKVGSGGFRSTAAGEALSLLEQMRAGQDIPPATFEVIVPLSAVQITGAIGYKRPAK